MAGSKAGGEKRWLEGFEAWVAECNAKHGNRYTYAAERVEDHGRMKVRITCPEHGDFLQMPAKHKGGQGCPRCSGNVVENYLERLQAAFPGQAFPDPLPSSKVRMTLVCKEHGEFKASINQLLNTKALANTNACPKCNKAEGGIKQRVGKDELLRRLQARWPDYLFDVPEDVKANDKVKYVCPKHGEHKSIAADMLSGHGCPGCGAEARSKNIHAILGRTTTENHEHLYKVHGSSLSFKENTLYRTHQKVEAVCPKHGPFQSMLYSLKAGHGCPSCQSRISKGEIELATWLKELGVDVTQQCRETLEQRELDILISDKSIAIEYCGLYWHSEKNRGRTYHLGKHKDAGKAGVHLITLFEDEWHWRKDAVKSALANILGLSTDKVYARKTTVKWVAWADVAKVYEQYHLQGAGTPCQENLVLEHEGKVVAAMSFKGDRFGDNDVELVRYVTTTKVPGGFTKLFSAYTKQCATGTKIVSYCDYRWFTGRTYKSAGFVQGRDSDPGYWWCKGTHRYSRVAFQKHKLDGKLKNFDPNKTEEQNMISNGYWKVWDCGMGKWVLTV